MQFTEGALTYPGKQVMTAGPGGHRVPADWGRVAWGVLREEAEAIAERAGELGMWTVFGSIHPLTGPNRPHNSLYVVSDRGSLVARYDKRFLSHTELSFLYSPGRDPLMVEVDGLRIGFALCIEARFPELFAEYERLDVDCVLLSVMADDASMAHLAQSYAMLYNYWVGYGVPAQFSATSPAGIVAPGAGGWRALPVTADPPWRSRTSTWTRRTRTSKRPCGTRARGAARPAPGSTRGGSRRATPAARPARRSEPTARTRPNARRSRRTEPGRRPGGATGRCHVRP
ncbi:carbon-nitrogen hydrolase family protein [Kitasatospora cheerisanensis]|uniref:carbon-nitrogen hydrolase family protein n=1 Tax=Kitasatospora cheerisanensis TaxID=81942 RepID=UPI001FCB3815|nr:carbon-nitrogen hydrolase family protein [Kitasatospora cheerisanensis]